MAPRLQLEKAAWRWTETVPPEAVAQEHIEAAYRVRLEPCQRGACRYRGARLGTEPPPRVPTAPLGSGGTPRVPSRHEAWGVPCPSRGPAGSGGGCPVFPSGGPPFPGAGTALSSVSLCILPRYRGLPWAGGETLLLSAQT